MISVAPRRAAPHRGIPDAPFRFRGAFRDSRPHTACTYGRGLRPIPGVHTGSFFSTPRSRKTRTTDAEQRIRQGAARVDGSPGMRREKYDARLNLGRFGSSGSLVNDPCRR